MTFTITRAWLVTASMLMLWSAVGSSAESDASESLAGSYEYIGGDAQIKAMYDSVEKVVKKMNVFARGIARSRLRKPNMPSAELHITIDAETITIARSGGSSVEAPRSGKAATWRGPSGTFQVSYDLQKETLLQTVDGKNSHSVNHFELAQDGVTLNIQTNISSSRLPAPVMFTMTYRRK